MHKQLRMQRITEENPEGKKALQMMMALALLPANQIVQGLAVIQHYVQEHNLSNEFRILLR